MGHGLRHTQPVLRLLEVLSGAPEEEFYGLELMDQTHLRSGTLYPVLLRLCDRGLVNLRREAIDPRVEGRAPRSYYRITPDGVAFAREALAGERDRVRKRAVRKSRIPLGLGEL
jgi:PadR family transcriptional regulator, regulatory protein PadR